MRYLFRKIYGKSTRPSRSVRPFVWMGVLLLVTSPWAKAEQEQPYIYTSSSLADGDFLKSWLVCGPFPNAESGTNTPEDWIHDARCIGLYTDYLNPVGGEAMTQPMVGQEIPAPEGEMRKWSAAESRHDHLFLGDYMAPTMNQVAYAACWIDCDTPEDRLVGLGSSDGIRVWVNGQETFRVHEGRDLHIDENYFRLPLAAGRNRVLLKIENGSGAWGFALRTVANTDALKALLPRLKEILQFNYEIESDGYSVTWGDPTVVGNLEGLPEARITLETQEGAIAGQLEVPLGHPFQIPFNHYGEQHYRISGSVLWPYRGRVKESSFLYRGDLREEVIKLLDGTQPEIAPSRAADAYDGFLGTVSRAVEFERFRGEPAAYRKLKGGVTRTLGNAVELQHSHSPYDRLFPKPGQVGTSNNKNVTISGEWVLSTADSIFDDRLENALFTRWTSHTADLQSKTSGHVYVFALETGLLATPIPELAGDDSEFAEPADSIRERVPTNPEGYAIRIAPGEIIVAGRTAVGAFYGMDTLLQLLGQDSPLMAATIVDAPVHPTRATVLPLESFDSDFRNSIDDLARLRMNTVFLPSSLYPDIEDEEIQPLITNAYDYCRSRFVEPIPLVETFGDKTLAAEIEPDLLEGVYIEELPVQVDDLRRLHLPYDRILDNESTTPRLRTGKGYKVLRKDRDFVFESYAPPVIQLKGKAPVQTGEILLVTADVVDHSIASTGASCPSDTKAWLLIEQVFKKIYDNLSPKGIHLGQTGAGFLNQDSRCLARELPNALLLADAIQKGYDIARKLDSNARIFAWGDHFNPLERARTLDAMRGAEKLPRDIFILDGGYSGATAYDEWRVEQGIRFFDQYGLKTLGVVKDDPLNIQQVAALNLRFPRRFQGIVHRAGDGPEDGRHLAAEAGWQGTTSLGMYISE